MDDEGLSLPDSVDALARAMLGWTLPAECLEGVSDNLRILADHRRVLEEGR